MDGYLIFVMSLLIFTVMLQGIIVGIVMHRLGRVEHVLRDPAAFDACMDDMNEERQWQRKYPGC